MTNLPKFSAALLHPRYWLTWLGIGILWLIVQLPYPILFKLGCALGRLALRLMKRRAKIVSRNLELCFPQMSEQERQQIDQLSGRNPAVSMPNPLIRLV